MTAREPGGPSARERPAGRRSQRELDALARAVRKAQQQKDSAGGDPRTERPERTVYRARRGRFATVDYLSSRSRGALAAAVLAAAIVVAAVLAFSLGSPARPSRQAAAGHRPSAPPSTGAPAATSVPQTTSSPATTTSQPATTTTTLPPTTTTIALAIPPPVLSSLEPARGQGGSVVVVHGRNFLSQNGLIEAYVGGRPTRTDCPAQDTCDVTIPTLAKKGSVPLTITTSAGRSNTLYFDYS